MSKNVEGEDGNEGDDHRRISPQHPSPILHAPRDNISRKGKSLTPIYIYIYIYIYILYMIPARGPQTIFVWDISYFHVAFSRHEFG